MTAPFEIGEMQPWREHEVVIICPPAQKVDLFSPVRQGSSAGQLDWMLLWLVATMISIL